MTQQSPVILITGGAVSFKMEAAIQLITDTELTVTLLPLPASTDRRPPGP
ncbi:DUF3010 family protein [Marinobacter algicola]